MRPHVAAIYAFARLADDMADEGDRPAARTARGSRRLGRAAVGRGQPAMRRPTVRIPRCSSRCAPRSRPADCRPSLLHDLVSAFRQDVTVTRYATWDDLLDYCRRSANPVGRLVLRVAGHDRPDLDAASDAVCTALQLTNFWQDLEIDWGRGRIYLPARLRRTPARATRTWRRRRMTPEWRRALRDAVARTRRLFQAGAPVCRRRARPAAVGASRDLAWRHADSR